MSVFVWCERLVPEIFHDFVALTLICSNFLYYSPLFVFSLFFAIFSDFLRHGFSRTHNSIPRLICWVLSVRNHVYCEKPPISSVPDRSRGKRFPKSSRGMTPHVKSSLERRRGL